MIKKLASNADYICKNDLNMMLSAYYGAKAEECLNIFFATENSRDKDEESFRWRIANNNIEIYDNKINIAAAPMKGTKKEGIEKMLKDINNLQRENEEMLKYNIRINDLNIKTVDELKKELTNCSPEFKTAVSDRYAKKVKIFGDILLEPDEKNQSQPGDN